MWQEARPRPAKDAGVDVSRFDGRIDRRVVAGIADTDPDVAAVALDVLVAGDWFHHQLAALEVDDQVCRRRYLDRRAEIARRVFQLDARVGLARRQVRFRVADIPGQRDANVIVRGGTDDVRPAVEFHADFPFSHEWLVRDD